MDEYMATIKLFAGNFAPQGWTFCHGQVLSISSNTALFSLIGTMYGGNGTTTFCLPDLRGRVAVGFGQGNGLSNVNLGERAGVESVNLNVNQIPAHTHAVTVTVNAAPDTSLTDVATGNVLANETKASPDVPTNYTSAANDTKLRADAATATAASTGGSQPHENRQPYLGLNYIICVQGIYPPRS